MAERDIYFDEKLQILVNIFGGYERHGHQYDFKCPDPNCNPMAKKLTVNLNVNKYRCWHCGYGGHDVVGLMYRYGKEYIARWYEMTGRSHLSGDDLRAQIELMFGGEVEEDEFEEVELPKEYKQLYNPTSKLLSKGALSYLRGRGLSRLDILRWQVGYTFDGFYGARIVVPSYDERGRLNYFVARSYADVEWSERYRNPRVKRENMIFNEYRIDWSSPVVLVEGVFDAMKAGTLNTIPTFGYAMNEGGKLFRRIVENSTPVILAFDGDIRKKEKYHGVISRLNRFGISVSEVEMDNGEDLGGMSKDDAAERISAAKKSSEDGFLKNYINEVL